MPGALDLSRVNVRERDAHTGGVFATLNITRGIDSPFPAWHNRLKSRNQPGPLASPLGVYGEDMAGFGETLRQARAHKGVTLREAEQATRINRHHLAALEDENFAAMPPLIYQRGIVRNYAVYLELDASSMLAKFEEAHGTSSPNAPIKGASTPPIDMPSHWAPNFAIIAFAVVLSAIVFAWGYSIWVTPANGDPDGVLATETSTSTTAQVDLATQLPDRPAMPTPEPTQEIAPTATTEEATGVVSGRQDAGDNQRASQETVEQPQDTTSVYQTGIAISAASDIELSLTVDGNLVYEGPLPAGQQTEMFVGSTFTVSTSSQSQTNFINSCGDTSPMGNVPDAATVEFAAHEGSCPAPAQ
jgi:cytoskeleton protein RodZ